MKQDTLDLATRALRETTEPDRDARQVSPGERSTRSRVMASLHQGALRRRTRAAFLLPIAAMFATVSAWGAASGKAPEVWDAMTRTLGIGAPPRTLGMGEPPEPARARLGRSSPVLRRSAEAAAKQSPAIEAAAPEHEALAPPATESAATASEPAAAPAVSPSAGQRAPARTRPASSSALAPRSRAAPDPGHELYRRAHLAHFGGQEPARALGLWEAYLREAPRGRFAVEARYNRALCLVRLRRNGEARRALEPFAEGAVGGYRQHEAQALLHALAE